ncbi:hypothetical protein Ac2012v2_006055 [Leucoagaricus gongylophorus]
MITGLIAAGSIWTARSCQSLYAKEEDGEKTASQPQQTQSQGQRTELNNSSVERPQPSPQQQNHQRQQTGTQSHISSRNQKPAKKACLSKRKKRRYQRPNSKDEAL